MARHLVRIQFSSLAAGPVIFDGLHAGHVDLRVAGQRPLLGLGRRGVLPGNLYTNGCLSDQVFGEDWARQIGLGAIYPQPVVQAALRSVWKYNWAPDVGPYNRVHAPDRFFADPGEAGLLNCTWPQGGYLFKGIACRDEVWTGVEYQVAGHMVWEGMVEEALLICRAVHDRDHPSKRNPWNEVECGDHYARGLASYGV
jgi:hypothetical protein